MVDGDLGAPRPDMGSRLGAAGVGATLLVLGLLLTATLATTIGSGDEAELEERYQASAEQTARALEREVAGYFDELTDIGAYLTSRELSDPAPPNELELFVRATGIFEGLPSIVGVIVLEQVPPAELDAFVASMRESDPAFTPLVIGETPPGRPHLFLTYYVPGAVDLALPVGTDISPISAIGDGIAIAGEQGTGLAGSFQDDPMLAEIAEATDFPALDLLLDVDFFMGVPVLGSGLEVGQATGATTWVAAPVTDFDSVLGEAAEGQPANLGLELSVDLVEVETVDDVDLSRAAERPGDAGPVESATLQEGFAFDVLGVPWSLQVWSSATPDRLPVALTWASGAMASLLAALLGYLRTRSRRRERAYADMLIERDQFRRAVLDSVSEPVVVVDEHGAVVATNPAWNLLRSGATGATADEGRGRGLDGGAEPGTVDVVHPSVDPDQGRDYLEVMANQARDDLGALRASFADVLSGAGRGTSAESARTREADVLLAGAHENRWFAVRVTPLRGEHAGAVVVHSDITERKRSEAALEQRATHDDLTGLLNRAAMDDEIRRAVADAGEGEGGVALLFVDLDGFKPINDTHGHAVGDDVLRVVAQRIASVVRSSDRVARLGGDEFVVLVAPLPDAGVAEATARRILDSFTPAIRVGDLSVPVGASIGLALTDAPLTAGPGALMALADRAMYAAKQSGGGRYVREADDGAGG